MELKRLVPGNFKSGLRKLIFGSANFGIHFSQGGEDQMILAVINSILKIDKGYYIDVGSFHPTIGSNTYVLYRMGWHGINIDPRPGSKAVFDKERPRDVNIEVGIGASTGSMKYYFISESSTMNSFSRQALADNGVLDQVTKIIECPIETIATIIQQHVPQHQPVDFLNIDAEGFEQEVLATIDWKNKRPKIIAIELNRITTLNDVLNTETEKLLTSNNYVSVCKNFITKTVATVIYIDKQYL